MGKGNKSASKAKGDATKGQQTLHSFMVPIRAASLASVHQAATPPASSFIRQEPGGPVEAVTKDDSDIDDDHDGDVDGDDGGDGKEGEETFKPCAIDNKYVVVARGPSQRASDKVFPVIPEDVLERRLASYDFRAHLRDISMMKGHLSEKENNERVEEVVQSFRSNYRTIPPAGLAAIDPLTGWHVLAPSSPFAASPEAFMPFTRRGATLCYHSQANVSVTMQFLNWVKGQVLFNIDLAVTAEWLRLRDNTQTPWAVRKPRFQWLAVAADNLAVARVLLGFASGSSHRDRHAAWSSQSNEHLEMILETVCTGRKTRLLGEKLQEARTKGRRPLDINTRSLKVKEVSKDEAQRVRKDCETIFKSYGGTREEFEACLLLDGEICPFHISSHHHLRARGYSLGLLRSILASSRFHVQCNKAADDLGLYEADLKVHWERLLYVIVHAVSQQAIRAVEEVRNRRPGEDRYSPGLIEEVQWLITDRRGLPITPFVHHPFQFVLATRGPPNTAMFSGYQRGEDGSPLPTRGPVLHPNPFDPVKSFRDDVRGISWDSRMTNGIMGRSDPSFWDWQFAVFSQIPWEGPFWKVDSSLGAEEWAVGPGRQRQLVIQAPRSSYPEIVLPEPPYLRMMDGQDQRLLFKCPLCPGLSHLDAGRFQLHLNQRHSEWEHRCRDCERSFSSTTAFEAHRDMNACIRQEVLDKATGFFRQWLYCQHPDCVSRPNREKFTEQRDLDRHYQSTHLPLEEQPLPTIVCECRRFWSSQISSIRRHQTSTLHKKSMKLRDGHAQLSQKYQCITCGFETKGEKAWDRHIASDPHRRAQFYSAQSDDQFKVITEASAIPPPPPASDQKEAGVKGLFSNKVLALRIAKRDKETKWRESPHTCKDCKLGFPTRWKYTEHLKTPNHIQVTGLHNNPQTFKFQCAPCQYGTNSPKDWTRHTKTPKHQHRTKPPPSDLANKVEQLSTVLQYRLASPQLTSVSGKPNSCQTCLCSFSKPWNLTVHLSSDGCTNNCKVLKTIHPEVAVAHEMAREQLTRPPPAQPAGPPPAQPAGPPPAQPAGPPPAQPAGPPPAQPAGPPPAQPTSRVASQNPASSRPSLKRPRSDDEEPLSVPKRRFSPRLAARSRSGTASMSPLVNELELGGTEDVGAPDVLSGPMEVDDGDSDGAGDGDGEDDALFDPMEVDDGDVDSEYEEGK